MALSKVTGLNRLVGSDKVLKEVVGAAEAFVNVILGTEDEQPGLVG